MEYMLSIAFLIVYCTFCDVTELSPCVLYHSKTPAILYVTLKQQVRRFTIYAALINCLVECAVVRCLYLRVLYIQSYYVMLSKCRKLFTLALKDRAVLS